MQKLIGLMFIVLIGHIDLLNNISLVKRDKNKKVSIKGTIF